MTTEEMETVSPEALMRAAAVAANGPEATLAPEASPTV